MTVHSELVISQDMLEGGLCVEEQLLAKGKDKQGKARLLLLLQDTMERASQAISKRSRATFSGAVRSAKLALISPASPPPWPLSEMCELRWKGGEGGGGKEEEKEAFGLSVWS